MIFFLNPSKMKLYKKSSDINYLRRVLVHCFALMLILFSSCVNQRDLEYIRDKEEIQTAFIEPQAPDYLLRPNDALYIQINSIGDVASNVFAQTHTLQNLDPYAAFMNSFIIDKEGFIELPVIGRLNVGGKTVTQVRDIVKDSLVNVLSFPTITVRLVNQYVSVLGEVRVPGHYVYSQDKFNIYNALGLAGDITVYGDRKKITIIRSENGSNNRITVDLTDPMVLSSPYYYIQPNDLVYVKPLPKRFWGMEEFPYAVFFSTITTALLIYTIFIQQD
jgi:polysaccharide export outer membrane protein